MAHRAEMLNDVVPLIAAANACSQPITKASKDPPLKLLLLARPRPKHRPEDDISVHSSSQAESQNAEDPLPRQVANTFKHAGHPQITLNHLPLEIQDGIIGFIHGTLSSAVSDGVRIGSGITNWNRVMRHPRRKQLSDLALVSRTWRGLVQQRLYRHIKIKGTKAELDSCGDWFLTQTHLQQYVRHLEVWVPVWEIRSVRRDVKNRLDPMSSILQAQSPSPTPQFTWIHDSLGRTEESTLSQDYQLASQNATMEEIFGCASVLFPKVFALTIEGGHCKKPPRIQHFRELRAAPPKNAYAWRVLQNNKAGQLPEHPNISTLVLKGAWNIIRQESDFHILSFALPNLREWHCTYSKPKPEAYQAICSVLRYFPATIVHLNISLEGLYSKEPPSTEKWREIFPSYHICYDLGRLCPQLESLAYTGRVCHCLFHTARTASAGFRTGNRLKSVDINVRNCCRTDPSSTSDGTGIYNWEFIQCFKKLVEAGVAALLAYEQLSFLRIRFIDLDSPAPLMNPYFHLQGLECSGIWNEDILTLLGTVRPGAGYKDLCEELGTTVRSGTNGNNGRALRTRPKSIKVSTYLQHADSAWGALT